MILKLILFVAIVYVVMKLISNRLSPIQRQDRQFFHRKDKEIDITDKSKVIKD